MSIPEHPIGEYHYHQWTDQIVKITIHQLMLTSICNDRTYNKVCKIFLNITHDSCWGWDKSSQI